MLQKIRNQAAAYWQDGSVSEMTPWDVSDLSQGARRCPRMTAVYDNNRCLMQLVLVFDVFLAVIWLVFIASSIAAFTSLYGNPPNANLLPLFVNGAVFSGMTAIAWVATVKAVRAERMMIVVGATHVLGMNDDWPRLQDEDESFVPDRPGDAAVDITPPQDQPEVKTFEFPDHDDFIPEDRRSFG